MKEVKFIMPNNVFIPELLAAGIRERISADVKLYNIVNREELGEQREGDTVTFVSTNLSPDAQVVPAGQPIPIADFVDSTKPAEIKKYAQAHVFTDEELMSGFGDVQQRAENKLSASVVGGIENALFAELNAITGNMLHAETTKTALDLDVLADAMIKFGDNVTDEMYLVVNPTGFAQLRKDNNFIVKSSDKVDSVGEIFGATVITSVRVPAKTAFLLKPEALTLALRKDVTVKVQEEAADDTVHVSARIHGAVALTSEDAAVKITLA